MRALCGAIITTGALIGLGLTALAFGQRYASQPVALTPDGLIHLSNMDRPLVFVLVFLTASAIVGVGITFLGLAYHHNRREREYLLHKSAGDLRKSA